MTSSPRAEDEVTSWLRLGLLGLAAAGIIGTAVELATIRHWDSTEQLIPWVVLAVAAIGVLAVAIRPSRLRVRVVQIVSLGTLAAAAFGVYEHIASNLESGPLDATYGPKWGTMSAMAKWWAAASGGVGPSPTLAPAVLAQISLCLLLATLAHPALRDRSQDAGSPP